MSRVSNGQRFQAEILAKQGKAPEYDLDRFEQEAMLRPWIFTAFAVAALLQLGAVASLPRVINTYSARTKVKILLPFSRDWMSQVAPEHVERIQKGRSRLFVAFTLSAGILLPVALHALA
jgi:hypothetical protein